MQKAAAAAPGSIWLVQLQDLRAWYLKSNAAAAAVAAAAAHGDVLFQHGRVLLRVLQHYAHLGVTQNLLDLWIGLQTRKTYA